jgi:hypothetical protein
MSPCIAQLLYRSNEYGVIYQITHCIGSTIDIGKIASLEATDNVSVSLRYQVNTAYILF